MDELISLFKKYKININTIGLKDSIYLEKYGVIIKYSQKDLCFKPPKVAVREILYKFLQDKKYKQATENYIKSLVKKQPIIETTLNIDDKKKLIRKKLNEGGLLNN